MRGIGAWVVAYLATFLLLDHIFQIDGFLEKVAVILISWGVGNFAQALVGDL